MTNFFVDDEMEDFEKESMRALIDLNATYGFDVKGIDYLHLNDIIYNIFVKEIMYTGAHIHRVDFLQDFISNIGFNTGELMYMDNINDALEASGSISNEKLTELKIKGYSLSEIIGLLYELRDKTTESTSDEDVTSIINGFLNQEVSPVSKVMKTGIDSGTSKEILGNTKSHEYQSESAIPAGMGGGKNNRISNPKHNTKYRKNYKKFVSKYIIKKKKKNNKNNKNNNKNNKKNNKNKTRKNKRLTKSKRNNKTLKNKKGKSKSSNHKSNHKSKFNKKTKTNYYNFYKHNKTLKH